MAHTVSIYLHIYRISTVYLYYLVVLEEAGGVAVEGGLADGAAQAAAVPALVPHLDTHRV